MQQDCNKIHRKHDTIYKHIDKQSHAIIKQQSRDNNYVYNYVNQ